ncbi:hypothetical protein ACOME3_002410 [Neoechinorhynchus agilis]
MMDMSKDIDILCDLLSNFKRPNRTPEDVDSINRTIEVLRSDYFSCIGNVYETVMNALDDELDVTDEVKVKAASQGTIAAFMASMGKQAHPRVVEIEKSEVEGLGFNVMGGREQKCPLFVARVIPNGPADRSKRSVRKGDQIIVINGVNVEDVNHETCVELLKQAKGTVTLVVRHEPELLKQFEDKLAGRIGRRQSINSSKSH